MTLNPNPTNRAEEPVAMEALDPAMQQALGDFKSSVHAWSDAVYSQPRTVPGAVMHRSWHIAAAWSLSVMLVAGTVSGGVYEHHQRVVAAQLAAQRAAEQQKQAALERAQKEAQEEEEMLASVDTTVSREVPAAMEPLAQLSEEAESR